MKISENAKVWLGLAGIITFFVMSSQYDGVKNSDEEAMVQVFPDSNSVKNYDLTASIDYESKLNFPFTRYTDYNISRIDWPNGGYTSFDDCHVDSLFKLVTCRSDEGVRYDIKINEYTEPEGEAYDPNY